MLLHVIFSSTPVTHRHTRRCEWKKFLCFSGLFSEKGRTDYRKGYNNYEERIRRDVERKNLFSPSIILFSPSIMVHRKVSTFSGKVSTISGKMSTISGKCQLNQENECQPLQTTDGAANAIKFTWMAESWRRKSITDVMVKSKITVNQNQEKTS